MSHRLAALVVIASLVVEFLAAVAWWTGLITLGTTVLIMAGAAAAGLSASKVFDHE